MSKRAEIEAVRLTAGLGVTPQQAIEIFNGVAGESVLFRVPINGQHCEFYQKTMNQESFIFALGMAGLLKIETPNVELRGAALLRRPS